jgi:hypothetical protein
LENWRAEQVLPGSRGGGGGVEVAQIMYTHVSKRKNNNNNNKRGQVNCGHAKQTIKKRKTSKRVNLLSTLSGVDLMQMARRITLSPVHIGHHRVQ